MRIFNRNIPLFLAVGFLFGIKTFILYRFYLQLDLTNFFQETILFLNAFFITIIYFGIAVWFKNEKWRIRFIFYSTIIGSGILYVNLLFYRSYTDFLTIPQITQVNNVSSLGSSIFSLIEFYDVFLFVDVILIWFIIRRFKHTDSFIYNRKNKIGMLVVSAMLLCFNLFISEIERPQLLTRAFDREYLVKNIGVFFYHLYDVAQESKLRTEKVLANSSDLKEIKNYIDIEIRSDEQAEFFGYARGRNVFFISAESVQKFVVENTIQGNSITPFLNELINDKDSFYFENFYHQTAQGKTSDSEFVTENSLYPLSSGAVFFTHAQNTYHSMPELLNDNGYDSYVFHANASTFWNRKQMYEPMKITQFFDQTYYDVTDEEEIGWGLKDKAFFTQSIPILKDLDPPFYAKLITITNHFPFELDEEDRSIEPYDSSSQILNNYFPTVRYTDESIAQFFDQLKKAGLYDNSVIIIMGDHDGISANHNKALAEFLDKDEITLYDYQKLQRVPFIIHVPGINSGKRVKRIAGQIDIKPTLLHLLGVKTDHDIYFGNDLFHNDRKGFIAQPAGGFISDDYLLINDECYDYKTGESLGYEIENSDEVTPCNEIKEKVKKELTYSDKIIYGDLFRFHEFKQ